MAEILNHTRVAADGREPERWLLVLHGIYGTGRNWGTIARRLVEQRPEWGALLVDLRLHGGSLEFPPPHTVGGCAADVDTLVDHLDFHAAAVLGHSFGGKVALLYAQQHADNLRQAWIIDSTLEVRDPSGTAWGIIDVVRALPSSFASRKDAVAGIEQHGYPTAVAQWLAMNLEPVDGVYRWRLDWEGIEEMLRDYFRTDVWPILETPPVGVEIHIVKANDSTAIDEQDSARIEAAGRTHGRVLLHRLEGSHWINTDNPQGVLDLLVSTLP